MINRSAAARIGFLAAVMLFGFTLVPVAFGDKGGASNGGNVGSGGNNGTPTTTTATATTSTTASTNNSKGGGKGAGGGGGGSASSSSSSLALVSEYIYNMPNPAAPTWCLNEDDIDTRTFTGSLNGSYATTYQLCDGWNDGIYWGAGGEGVQASVSVVGTLSDMSITAPDGTVQHGVFVGTSVSGSGANQTTTNSYEVCVMPPFSVSTNTGTDPLAGGTWTVILSGQISRATWNTTVQMAYPSFQELNCPGSEQNLTP